MTFLAYPEEIDAVATFEFWTSFKNMWQTNPLAPVYNKITTVVNYIDGYEYLNLQIYQDNVPKTIDLTTGSATVQFLPPLFSDDLKTGMELNPADLIREITIKLVDE